MRKFNSEHVSYHSLLDCSHLSRSYIPSAFLASELERIPSTPPLFFNAGAAHMSHDAAASRASSMVATVVFGGSLALSAEKVGVDAVIICSVLRSLIGSSSFAGIMTT